MAKMVEIEEGEYNQMVALRGIASKMVQKPESRRLLEQAQKLVDPNAATPLLDQEAAQLAPVKEMESKLAAEIAALKKEREDEKREATLAKLASDQARGFAKLKSEHHYTDEGVEAVRKVMETKGLLDVDDAVAIFERSNPPQMPATPSGHTGGSWNFMDENAGDSDKNIAALIANKGSNEAATDRMVNQALQELRGQARR